MLWIRYSLFRLPAAKSDRSLPSDLALANSDQLISRMPVGLLSPLSWLYPSQQVQESVTSITDPYIEAKKRILVIPHGEIRAPDVIEQIEVYTT